ncbi:HIT family protein [Fretibacter rubidus]|uniref:HIT family protein n=1 Tax=Fretibacter rubidus TaxID=570162 RepID=UPI00352B1F30
MTLHAPYDASNIFAKIMAGDVPCAKIYEDDDVLSFMDAFPQTRGHCLVIPKAASRNILDTDPDVLARVITKVQKIAKGVEATLSPDGIVVTQFNGAPAGQTVFHLHFHIIPRYDGDKQKPHASGAMANMDDLLAIAEQIKQKLQD